MKKTARKKIPAVSALAAKKSPVAGRVARGAGHGSQGKVVASCPEFTLYADGWLESSPEVEGALVRALMRTNRAPGAGDRERMRLGLWNLMLLAARRFPGDPDAFRDQLLDNLADTIGKTLLDALGPGFDWQDEKARKSAGKKRRIDEASKRAGRALARAVADLETAVASLARFRADIPLPGDKSPGAWTWMIQQAAKEIFRETRERPTKTAIRVALEGEGWTFKGNDPAENWRRVFEAAGLDSLPL